MDKISKTAKSYQSGAWVDVITEPLFLIRDSKVITSFTTGGSGTASNDSHSYNVNGDDSYNTPLLYVFAQTTYAEEYLAYTPSYNSKITSYSTFNLYVEHLWRNGSKTALIILQAFVNGAWVSMDGGSMSIANKSGWNSGTPFTLSGKIPTNATGVRLFISAVGWSEISLFITSLWLE